MTKDEIKKLKNAFYSQRCSARNRVDRNGNPIEFRLTFEEWLQIWLESGHLHERGKLPHQYVMSRYNDIGHYEVGNVCIKTFSENRSEAASHSNKNRKGRVASDDTKKKMSNTHKNLEYHKRKCRTPLGEYSSVTEAAYDLGVSMGLVLYRIKNKKPGYEYV